MTITFPITPPSTPGIRNVTMKRRATVARSVSPFTREEQIQVHQGQWWEAHIELPPMTRSQAQDWIAFLTQLNGLEGRFYLTPPGSGTPEGDAGGTPLVKGASQTGATLITDGWTVSTTGILKAGDYIQLNSGENARLHMNLTTVNSDGSGDATLDLWPDMRESPSDNSAITVTDPVGVFRLADNESNWSIQPAMIYGIAFDCVEAV